MRWSTRTAAAEWIRPRLAEFSSGLVTSVIPGGFPAYARILHPLVDARERTVRWSDVAAWSGSSLDTDAQFHDIALPEGDPGPCPWSGQGPAEGTLAPGDVKPVVENLREHSATPDQCWFCLWDGYGWDNTVVYSASAEPEHDRDRSRLPDPLPAVVRHGPQVHLPNRDYFLYTGPVEDAGAFLESHRQTANLWWPEDHSWCVASEIDLTWTYVGGSEELIQQLVADPRIEAQPIEPGDTHHIRLRGWLRSAVAAAVLDLLTTGEAAIVTPLVTLRADLRRTGLRRRGGTLRIRCAHREGCRGESSAGVRAQDEEELRERIEFQLTLAAAGMAVL